MSSESLQLSNKSTIDKVSLFYEKSYEGLGFNAQRKYPNEELCRFMGRNFFHVKQSDRQNIRILETGCGSGGNLWMIAKEGFDAYGIDLSSEAIKLCKIMLDNHNTHASISQQNMMKMDFAENYFDAVIDVFSSYCLTRNEHFTYLKEVQKLLKPNGVFFSYFPSKTSDAYIFPKDASFIDPDTLSSISRKDSPFCGQNYPFRFIHYREYEDALGKIGFRIQYSEIVNKTYRTRQEQFSFVIIEAVKE